MSRLILVANRLPVSVDLAGGGVEIHPSSGGLASGMRGLGKAEQTSWVGWPGGMPNNEQRSILDDKLKQHSATPVYLSSEESKRFYEGMSNSVIWPLFHYLIDRMPLLVEDFDEYVAVNERFADCVCTRASEDDLIWIHDYHLLLLPQILRHRLPRARIGFFLHIPFPASQVLLAVPPHRELVEALCSFDLLGFQTKPDLRAFCDYIVNEAGGAIGKFDNGLTRIDAFGQTLSASDYPIGVYPDEIAELAKAGERGKPVRTLKATLHSRKVIMSVDRLDYSKGLVERFRAFERLLDQAPAHRNRVSFVQIAPPTRADLHAYQDIRLRLEAESGRINGRFAELDWTPIWYIHRQYERAVLAALFRASNVGYVTPLRDGMNLVAKEYVSAQDPENPGVLVLSRFAGAAQELTGALIVNPLDIDGMADALATALAMPLAERQARHADMLSQLRENNVSVWRDRFMRDLSQVAERGAAVPLPGAAVPMPLAD
jgi:trehalose 6-phosphate synthase